MDDFGLGYEGNEHAIHLLQTLRQYYEAVSIDWMGTLFCGITLKWDYLQQTCKLSMIGYVQHALNKFQYGITNTHKATDAPIPIRQPQNMAYP